MPDPPIQHARTTTPTGATPIVGRLDVNAVSRSYAPRRARGTKQPGVLALHSISVSIEPGSFVAILGPNGSGKSTLLRILATSDRPDTGMITFNLIDPTSSADAAAAYRRGLGIAFQNPGLDKLLTVRENLELAGAISGLSAEHTRSRIAALGLRLGIADRLADRVGTLSGGLARRVDLCRALLAGPALLLLDEATAGLDLAARRDFLQLVLDERASQDPTPTTVMATHLMDEAETADRVVMLHRGRIVADGTPDELRRRAGTRQLRILAAREADHAALHHVLSGIPKEAASTSGDESGPREITIAISGEAKWLAPCLASLSESDLTFQVSSPTLGDAYLMATGESLATTNPSQKDPRATL